MDERNIVTHKRRSPHAACSIYVSDDDPKNYNQAISCPNQNSLRDAINLELKNMIDKNVWTEVGRTKCSKPMSTKWVFKTKTDADGNLTKHKARLCVRGFAQKEGVDYNEVFSPTGGLTL